MSMVGMKTELLNLNHSYSKKPSFRSQLEHIFNHQTVAWIISTLILLYKLFNQI